MPTKAKRPTLADERKRIDRLVEQVDGLRSLRELDQNDFLNLCDTVYSSTARDHDARVRLATFAGRLRWLFTGK